jgi:hypothetical protein
MTVKEILLNHPARLLLPQMYTSWVRSARKSPNITMVFSFVACLVFHQFYIASQLNYYTQHRSIATNATLTSARKQNRTLVALVGNIRGGEAVWNSLYRHVLDVNQADLALVVGADANHTSSLYSRAKYIWEIPEYDDWSKGIDYLFGTSEDDVYSWRDVAKKNQNGPFGGTSEDPFGSGAVQGILRHGLAENLVRLDLLNQYDRFIVTRTDQFYTCDLSLEPLDPSKIWVPTGEDWGGICDRFFACGKDHIIRLLDTLPPVIRHPEKYYNFSGNIKSFLKMRWVEEGLFEHVERFPRINFVSPGEGDKKSRWLPKYRFKAFIENGIQVYYKHVDEYFSAMSSPCGASADMEQL